LEIFGIVDSSLISACGRKRLGIDNPEDLQILSGALSENAAALWWIL
jgi:hypothetical protein